MSEPIYKEKLESFKADRAKLAEQRGEIDVRRAEIDRKIQSLDDIITALSRLVGETTASDLNSLGFTDACRAILRASTKPMLPTEVRDALQAKGYNLTEYSNPLASVHTVLKRLHESREARPVEESGKTAYRWNFGAPAPPPIPHLGLDPPAATPAPPPQSIFKPKK